MALIKREILTSCKVLHTKSWMRNQFLFCKKEAFHLRKKNWHSMFCKGFPSFSCINKVNLSSFQLKIFSNQCLQDKGVKSKKILMSQPCLHTLMQTLFLANQSVRTILFYKQLYNHGTLIILSPFSEFPAFNCTAVVL